MVEIILYGLLGVLGTVLFWMGFVALAGSQYWLAGQAWGALVGLGILACVYERNRGKNAGPAKESR